MFVFWVYLHCEMGRTSCEDTAQSNALWAHFCFWQSAAVASPRDQTARIELRRITIVQRRYPRSVPRTRSNAVLRSSPQTVPKSFTSYSYSLPPVVRCRGRCRICGSIASSMCLNHHASTLVSTAPCPSWSCPLSVYIVTFHDMTQVVKEIKSIDFHNMYQDPG